MNARIAVTPDTASQHPCMLDPRCRRRLALVVTSTSAMIAGLVVGYALGVQQSFQRALARGDHHGI